MRLGLFEHPYVDESRIDQVQNAPEHQQLARTAVQRATILLRNQNSVLPLNKNKLKSIAVIGPLADDEVDLLSMWGALAKTGPTVSILQGIRDKVGSGVQVNFAHGPNLRREIASPFEQIPAVNMQEQPAQSSEQVRQSIDQAVALARQSDVAVVVLGELDLMSGEAASRASLELSGGQEELLEAVVAIGKPVVLVLVNGRPLQITWAAEHVPAILEAWYPGSQGGNGIADLLFGDATPGGHLPVSWPRTSSELPLYYNHNLTQEPETAPDFKSRYWDVLSTPLYPFGYGLSYTNFRFQNLKTTPSARLGGNIDVAVDVTNTGSRAGDDVVQLYIHQRSGSASRPVRQLKGFERVTLQPGATRLVHFTLGREQLQFWSPSLKRWLVEPEQFDVWVGDNSAAALHGEFRLTQ
jgi:beta-glucosidase